MITLDDLVNSTIQSMNKWLNFRHIFGMFILLFVFSLYLVIRHNEIFLQNKYNYKFKALKQCVSEFIKDNFWTNLICKSLRFPIVFTILLILFVRDYDARDIIIFNLSSEMHNVYLFVISVIMIFTLDIAFGQVFDKDVDELKRSDIDIKYLGKNKLRILFNSYFKIHNLVKSKIFYLLIFYFTIFPIVIFNYDFRNTYKHLALTLLSLWQIDFLFIIIILVFLIISDLDADKGNKYIQSHDKEIKSKIKSIYGFKMRLKIHKDRVHDSNYFVTYLNILLNNDSLCNNKNNISTIIEISINVFNHHLLGKSLFHNSNINTIFNIIKQYLNLLNRYSNYINNKMALRFLSTFDGYLYLLNQLFSKNKLFFVEHFIPNDLNDLNVVQIQNNVLPFFLFRHTNDTKYLACINGSVSAPSGLFAQMLHDNNVNDVSEFRFSPSRYKNNKELKFVQCVLRILITHDIKLINRVYRHPRSQVDLNFLKTSMILFNQFLKGYLSNNMFENDVGNDLSRDFVNKLKREFPKMKYK